MKSIGVVLALALCVALCAAECPNACSGHGSCAVRDQCSCFKTYIGNDCSQRVCPFGIAHIDLPLGDLDADGSLETSTNVQNHQIFGSQGAIEKHPFSTANQAHGYAECSHKGTCNRETGECECMDGYTGGACQRTVCPNACSGHGACKSALTANHMGHLPLNYDGNMAYGLDSWRLPYTKRADRKGTVDSYKLWDKYATYGCLCDPGYYGADCSLKLCSFGVDPLYLADSTPVYESVHIYYKGTATGVYKIKFFDVFGQAYTTEEITPTTDETGACTAVTDALTALPNSVVPSITCGEVGGSNTDWRITLSFTGNPGVLKQLEIVEDSSGLNKLLVISGLRHGEFNDVAATILVDSGGTTVTTSAGDATGAPASNAHYLTPSTDCSSLLSAGDIIKVDEYYLPVAALTADPKINTIGAYWGPATFSAATIFTSTDSVGTTSFAYINKVAAGSDLFSITIKDTTSVTLAAGDEFYFASQRFRALSVVTSRADGVGEGANSAHMIVKTDKTYHGNGADGQTLTTDAAWDTSSATIEVPVDLSRATGTNGAVEKWGWLVATQCAGGFYFDNNGKFSHHITDDGGATTLPSTFTSDLMKMLDIFPEVDDGFGVTASRDATDGIMIQFDNNHAYLSTADTGVLALIDLHSGAATGVGTADGQPSVAGHQVTAFGGADEYTTDLPAFKVDTSSRSNFAYVQQCAGRGVCDTSTGLCSCFTGYYGASCETQNVYMQ